MSQERAGRRVHERYDRRLPVVILHGEREIEGVTRNVSLGGMFVESNESIDFGAEVRVRMRLPALKEQTEVPCTVRWVTKEGIGLQFGSLRALEVWALNQLFKQE